MPSNGRCTIAALARCSPPRDLPKPGRYRIPFSIPMSRTVEAVDPDRRRVALTAGQVRRHLTPCGDDRIDEGPDHSACRDPTAGRHRARAGVRGRAHRPRRVPARAPGAATERRARGVAAVVSRQGILRADRIRVDRYTVTFLVDANVFSEATKPVPQRGWSTGCSRTSVRLPSIPSFSGRFGSAFCSGRKAARRLEPWFREGVSRVGVCRGTLRPASAGRGSSPIFGRRVEPCRSRTA